MDRLPVIVSLVVLLTIGLVLSATGIGAASGSRGPDPAATATNGPDGVRLGTGGVRSATVGAVANNTTQHEDPEEMATSEDVDDITRWLEGRLADRLGQSTIELSQGEAGRARRLLGEAFADQFERYAYVTGNTDADSDDQSAEQFRETRETQDEFVTAVQEYRETRSEYEEARQNGNEDRARRLARELQRLSRTTNRTGSSLQTNYGTLSNGTVTDLSEASTTVRNITGNISQQQAEIVEETFVRTALTLQPESRRISFLDPLRLTGRLTDENGSRLAERTVRLRIGDRTIRTETNADGTFTATYRPTLLRADEQTVTVRFLPRNESIYLGSNGSVTVSVAQITPDLSVEQPPEPVAFDDQVEITGTLGAEGIGAGDVPVTVRLGGVRLGTTRTTADGTYSFNGRVPASVDDGERALTVSVPLEDQALAGVERSRPLAVDPTETALTVSGAQVGEATVRVSGTLETDGSKRISGQQIDIVVDGQSIATARTDSKGEFTERVSVPVSLVPEEGNASVTLAARYERSNSNLLPSRARTTLRLRPLASGTGDSRLLRVPEDIPTPLAVAAAVGGLLVLVGGAVYLRRGRADRTMDPSDEGSADSPTDLRSSKPPEQSTAETTPMLAGASAALDDGDCDTAVKLAYTALKQTTIKRLDLPDGTHWEFFVACQKAGLDEDRIDTLRRLTETYEQAAFAPRTVPEADASWSVETAETFDRSIDVG